MENVFDEMRENNNERGKTYVIRSELLLTDR